MNLTSTNIAGEMDPTSTHIAGEMDPTSTHIAGEMDPTSTNMGSIEDVNTMKQEHAVNIPSTSYTHELPRNLPCSDLVIGSRQDYIKICVPLYEASITGDWPAAKAIFVKRPELVRFAITENYDTALHVAASAEHSNLTKAFVKNLVGLMERRDLELENKNCNTALCSAVVAGNLKMAKIMVERNSNLMDIPGKHGIMPLYLAALSGKNNMVKYLYDASWKLSGDFWTNQNRGWLLCKCVESDIFDVALKIVMDRPELAQNRDVLLALARKPDALNGEEQNLTWRIKNSIFKSTHRKAGPAHKYGDALQLLKIISANTLGKMSKLQVDDLLRGLPDPLQIGFTRKYSSRILFVATEMGNTRFVVELFRVYPDLLWKANDDNRSIFHIAVMHRHQSIFNILYEIGSMKDMITPLKDKDGNNMLHLVGKTSKEMRTRTSGASLLMQRELLWFKEVEKMLPPSYRERKNKDGYTPYELFSEKNEDLVSQGLKWMKDCMVVTTLIITVAFAVAFTVPGGYNQEHGFPIFIHERTFLVFIIADAISLFFSSTSLLVFLSILTSRYSQRDFLYSLPRKLIIGLVTLFISVAAMMVTFSTSFFVLYRNGLKWVPILIATFALMPVIVFVVLQLPLLVDMFRSMYDSRYLFNPKKRTLYNTN